MQAYRRCVSVAQGWGSAPPSLDACSVPPFRTTSFPAGPPRSESEEVDFNQGLTRPSASSTLTRCPPKIRSTLLRYLQLDWPWVTEWAHTSIFAVAVLFQNQDRFRISHQKIRSHFLICFKKLKNELVWPKMVFFQFQQKNQLFFNNSNK